VAAKRTAQAAGGTSSQSAERAGASNRLSGLLQREEELLAAIGRIGNSQEAARRRWIQTGINDWHKQSYTDPAEADLPLLKGRLENVRAHGSHPYLAKLRFQTDCARRGSNPQPLASEANALSS
jgi:hypothetical protein